MAALQCEICGGKLMGRPGGIFECDSCGMQYDTAWAKEKIQEIKGTVKVEGTVQVAGTVKVEGPVKVEGSVTKESLLKHAALKMEEKKFTHAVVYLKQALDMDPESGDIYWGLMMGRNKLGSVEELLSYTEKDMTTDPDFKMVMRFGTPEQKAVLAQWQENYNLFLAEKAADAADRAAQEAAAQAARDARRPALEARRRETMLARNMLANVALYEVQLTLVMPDGTVQYCEGKSRDSKDLEALQMFRDVLAAKRTSKGVFFLTFDGNVAYSERVEGSIRHGTYYSDPKWIVTDGEAVAIGNLTAYKRDGTVLSWETDRYGNLRELEAKRISAERLFEILAYGPYVYNEPTVFQAQYEPLSLPDGVCTDTKTKEILLENVLDHIGSYYLLLDGTVKNLNKKDQFYLDVSQWKNVVAIYRCANDIYALTEDGFLLENSHNRLKRSEKRYFDSLAQLQKLRAYQLSDEAKQHRRQRNRKEELGKEQEKLSWELGKLGMFDGKRKKEIKSRLSEIAAEIKELK